jgi:hypothetical protein
VQTNGELVVNYSSTGTDSDCTVPHPGQVSLVVTLHVSAFVSRGVSRVVFSTNIQGGAFGGGWNRDFCKRACAGLLPLEGGRSRLRQPGLWECPSPTRAVAETEAGSVRQAGTALCLSPARTLPVPVLGAALRAFVIAA